MARKAAKKDNTSKPLTSDQYDKAIQQLVEQGKKDSKLDQRDIFAAIPDTPANIDVLDRLYAQATSGWQRTRKKKL
jgi:hypothetical protein